MKNLIFKKIKYFIFILFLTTLKNIFSLKCKVIKPYAEIYAVYPIFKETNLELKEIYSSKKIKTIIERCRTAFFNDKFEIIFKFNNYYAIKNKKCFYFGHNEKLKNIFFIKDSDIEILDKKVNKKENNKGIILKIIYINDLEDFKYLLPGTKLNIYLDKENNFYVLIKDKKIIIKKEDFILKKDILKMTINEKRKFILNILHEYKSYADENNSIYPYVFGGNAFGILCKLEDLIVKIDEKNNNTLYLWKDKKDPIGSDCSGIILLLCRILNIPMYLANTYTQSKLLKKIENYNDIKNSDFLWIPGHIFIIDKENNLLLEYCGYDNGYFGLTIKKISDRFLNIANIKDLFNKYINNESIYLIDRFNKTTEIKNFKILSLESSYEIDYNKLT